MTRTLYLHIGAPRTGTTSIQNFLFANSNNLLKRGYLYPFRQQRHDRQMNWIFDQKISADEFARRLHRLSDDKRHEVNSIILSDEDICARRSLKRLAPLRKHFDVRVVYFLRRQDLWLESWYFQNVKWQWNPDLSHATLKEFLDRRRDFHWIDYDRYVRKVEKVFGAENLKLVVFEAASIPDGPAVEFCRRIGLEDLSGFRAAKHANARFSPEMSEFMRLLPLDLGAPPIRNVLVRACAAVDSGYMPDNDDRGGLILPETVRRAIMAEHAAGNARLARRRFGRDDLFGEPLPEPGAPMAQMTLPDDSYALMQKIVAPLVAELIRSGSLRSGEEKTRSRPAAPTARRSS